MRNFSQVLKGKSSCETAENHDIGFICRAATCWFYIYCGVNFLCFQL